MLQHELSKRLDEAAARAAGLQVGWVGLRWVGLCWVRLPPAASSLAGVLAMCPLQSQAVVTLLAVRSHHMCQRAHLPSLQASTWTQVVN